MNNIDVSVIIVSYNSRNMLRDCLKSVRAGAASLRIETIVVDNVSADGSPEMVEKEFPEARLIRNRRNDGFGRANNIAYRECQGRHILMLNPDAVLPPDSLPEMARFLDEHPEAGGVTPKLIGGDGGIQHFALHERTYSHYYLKYLFCSYFNFLFRPLVENWRRQIYLYDSYGKVSEVGFISGTCFMVSRQVLKVDLELFDPRFFMFAEDMDLSLRIRSRGYKLYLLPHLAVFHFWGGSCVQTPSFNRNAVFSESTYRFLRKHFGARRAALFRLIVLLGGMKDFLLSSVRSALSAADGRRYLEKKLRESKQSLCWGLGLLPQKKVIGPRSLRVR